MLHFRNDTVAGWAACVDPYRADSWEAWFGVQPGDVIFEPDDTLSMIDFHRIADSRAMTLEEVQALSGGYVTRIPDASAKERHEVYFRRRGGEGTLIGQYLRREDESDVALLRRRARGEAVPEIPADEELPTKLERRLEAVRPVQVRA